MPKYLLKKPTEKQKPWGREIWFAWTKNYAGKILELKKGHRFSLQFHERKSETQLVIQGKVEYEVGRVGGAKRIRKPGASKRAKKGLQNFSLTRKILRPSDKIDFPPYTIHRARAITDSIIFEVSTPELDDVVKLADDYGRNGRGNNEKLDTALSKRFIS